MNNSNISKELSNYLKTKKGLDRLINILKEKYISLSRPSGIVIVKNITEEESIDISNLLGKRIEVASNLKTSFREVSKKINEGKYANFNWEELFNYYFEQKIITKKDINFIAKNNEYLFFNSIYEENINKKYLNDIKNIIANNNNINKIIKKKYHQDKLNLKKEIENILLLLDNIPNTPTPLAVYSSITGDPHYLDLNKSTSNLFIRFLAIIKNVEYHDITERKINILYEINVYVDPLSNYVITYKLTGNEMLNKLAIDKEVVNINLLNLKKINKLDTKEKKVFVFENPSILLSLKDHNINLPIVITSGIPNLAVYEVLKRLDNKNNKIYYNGDFDPEGLMIVKKLKEKIPSLQLFCYEEIDYNNSKSTNKITESRLKKLNNINDLDLKVIKNMLTSNKLSGYQEQNLDRIKKYLTNESSL